VQLVLLLEQVLLELALLLLVQELALELEVVMLVLLPEQEPQFHLALLQ
jgi:hypothetical protein